MFSGVNFAPLVTMFKERLNKMWAAIRPHFTCKENKRVDLEEQEQIAYIQKQKLGLTLSGYRLQTGHINTQYERGFYGKDRRIYYAFVTPLSTPEWDNHLLTAVSSKTMASSKKSSIDAQYIALLMYNAKKQVK